MEEELLVLGCGDLFHRVKWHSLISMQVDGKYEDWMEVLRLIYHSGGFTQEYMSSIPGIHHDVCIPHLQILI
jgi:hypothetical protein